MSDELKAQVEALKAIVSARDDMDVQHAEVIDQQAERIAEFVATLTNVSMCARRGISFGRQATPHKPERMIQVKEKMLADIVGFCEAVGVHGSILREAQERAEQAESRADQLAADLADMTTRHREYADALLVAQQQGDQLKADVLSLSHPVCQQLLKDKRQAEAEVEAENAQMRREIDRLTQEPFRLTQELAKARETTRQAEAALVARVGAQDAGLAAIGAVMRSGGMNDGHFLAGAVTAMREHLAQAEAEVERQAEQLRMCSRAIDLLNKDKDALTRETCDLTGRLDIARQGCGIAEADRDKWKAAYENLTRRVIGADREVGDE